MVQKRNVPEAVQDDINVKGVYSNRLINTTYDGAVVMLTLAWAQALPERIGDNASTVALVPTAVVNNRLALPVNTLLDMHRAIGDVLAFIQQQAKNAPHDNRPKN